MSETSPPGKFEWLKTMFQIQPPAKTEGVGTDGSAPMGPSRITYDGKAAGGSGINQTPSVNSGASGGSRIKEPVPPK